MLQKHHRTGAVALLLSLFVFNVFTPFASAQSPDAQTPMPAPATASSALSAPLSAPQANQDITVIEASGEVLVQKAGSSDWIQIQKGAKLSAADIIKTGAKGAAALSFDGKARVDIVPNSQITVDQAARNGGSRITMLTLDLGRLKADVAHLTGESRFEIKSPTAVASVRGTTLFMNFAKLSNDAKSGNTDLYVDKGLVKFTPLATPTLGTLVDKYGLSSILGDGSMLDIKHLTAEERNQFIDLFNQAFSSAGNPQTETEEEGDDSGEDADDADDSDDLDLADVQEDQNRRNLAGDNLQILFLKARGFLLSEGMPESGDFKFDFVSGEASDQGIVSKDRIEARNALLAAGSGPEAAAAFNTLLQLRANEREKMANEMRHILNDVIEAQHFNLIQAQIDRAGDQQTGKVFTDMHGNRVRTDQYIFQPDNQSLNVVSLTLRTGEYQPGITSVVFGVQFNDSIPDGMSFRDLPWGDYMNVVTRHEMAERLGIPEEKFNEEFERWDPNPDYEALAEQYIVHESALANGLAESGFWPKQFFAEFRNPQGEREASDLIRFDEFFESPEDYVGNDYYLSGQSNEGDRYLVQPLEASLTTIAPSGQQQIVVGDVMFEGEMRRFVQIGEEEIILPKENSDMSADDAQTREFADFANMLENRGFLKSADGINFLRNFENNENGDTEDDLHPAYFEDILHDRYEYIDQGEGEGYDQFLGRNALLGLFVPIDNDGNVLEADGEGNRGFAIHSIRDLFMPNPLVNDGSYNLETIFSYGYISYDEGGETFHEDFRIDAILTPELLTHHNFVNTSENFPATLDEYEDDHRGQGGCEPYCYDE